MSKPNASKWEKKIILRFWQRFFREKLSTFVDDLDTSRQKKTILKQARIKNLEKSLWRRIDVLIFSIFSINEKIFVIQHVKTPWIGS